MNDVPNKYDIDIVFCIDCTETMDNILNIVKTQALRFYDDLKYTMAAKNKYVDHLRIRLVAFRDYVAYDVECHKKVQRNEPMLVSDFFTLPQDARKFEISVKSLQPVGGGDAEEDGLEALAYAIRSDWSMQGNKERHIIVLWTDAEPHSLGQGRGTVAYPRGMARDFDELTNWWGDQMNPGYMPKQASKRLLLFAPDKGMWSAISDNWDKVIHCVSNAGDGLRELDYQVILSQIAETI